MIELSNTLAHTARNCKYHIVFAPKYRRKVFYGQIRSDVKEIIRQLCFQKGVELLEGELCPDHVHILVAIPPKLSVSSFMGYPKGKSSMMIYEKYGNLKFRYRNRQFWCRGYYADTAGKNTKKIQEYIENQLRKDEEMEQLTLEGLDPFTGKKR
ncbi:MAG: IS200/IS605 family transposase [Erysipelotrichaceae bacterium]|nr:IS200/IS605 family transposase [Erysipelotrichaceae bacterium]